MKPMIRRRRPPALLMVALLACLLAGGCLSRPSGWEKRGALPEATQDGPPIGVVWAPGEPRVFTVFAHGTGGHRTARDGEIVTEFGAAYWGRGATEDVNDFYERHYQRTFLILDGVGTTAMTTSSGETIGLATEVCPEHPMPGDFWPDTVSKPLKPEPARVSEMVLAKTAWTAHRGDLMGDGWDDNVIHTLYVLGRLDDAGQRPEVINVIGWSRGAVTGIKLANAICDWFVDGRAIYAQRDYMLGYAPENLIEALPARPRLVPVDDIEINLFLIDPVPGRFGGDGETFGSKRSIERFAPDEVDYQQLPRIVRRCLITLANDEQREGFAPLDANDVRVLAPSRAQVAWLPFPGNHRTQVRVMTYDVVEVGDPPEVFHLTSVPVVVWDLAWRFLTYCGTEFQENAAIDGRLRRSDELVELYADMWLLRKPYHEVRNRGPGSRVMGGLMPRIYTGYPFAGREYSGLDPIQRDRARSDLFTANFGVYTQSPGFFVNEHHRACFETAYPETYRYLTGAGPARSVPPAAADELRGLDDDTALWRQLEGVGMRRAGDGFHVVEDFRFGDQLGEPLRKDDPPAPARFTGALNSMGLITEPHPDP